MSPNVPAAALTRKDFASDQEVRWCPGCGDYAILAALQRTLPKIGATPDNTAVISGIGCSSRFPFYMNTYGFHTIHGRAPAIASGLKLANPDLNIWVITGDGDGLSIGGNHLLHALRRNIDLNIMLFNNEIYGLTKGQYSPTSKVGTISPSSPMGSIDSPIAPVRFALGSSARFIARGFDTSKRLPEVLERAQAHQGASFIEILQNCPVFNDGVHEAVTDRKTGPEVQVWLEHGEPMLFGAQNEKGLRLNPKSMKLEVVDVSEGGVSVDEIVVHDKSNRTLAWLLAELEEVIPLGVLYENPDEMSYEQASKAQLNLAAERSGIGDMQKLLESGHTWTIA